MPGEIAFLSLDEAIAIHEALIERSAGTRTSAIGALRVAPDESAVRGRNKRVAFFATDVFLRLNGWKIVAEADAAHRFLIGLLETRTAGVDRLLAWLREDVRQRP